MLTNHSSKVNKQTFLALPIRFERRDIAFKVSIVWFYSASIWGNLPQSSKFPPPQFFLAYSAATARILWLQWSLVLQSVIGSDTTAAQLTHKRKTLNEWYVTTCTCMCHNNSVINSHFPSLISWHFDSTVVSCGLMLGSSSQHCCIRSTNLISTVFSLAVDDVTLGITGRKGGVSPLRTRPMMSGHNSKKTVLEPRSSAVADIADRTFCSQSDIFAVRRTA